MRPHLANVIALSVALLAAILGGPWMFRQLTSLPRAAELAARSQQRIVTLEVRGVEDGPAARRVERSLTAVPGVTAADVRPAQARAYVVCGHEVGDSLLVQAVERTEPGLDAAVVAK